MHDGGDLVGRAPERSQFQQASFAAARGQGRVVTIAGEPGVGKTALVRATTAEAARRHGARVLWGDCYEGWAQAPFGPWDTALAPLGGLATPNPDGLSSPEVRLALFTSAHAALVTARGHGPLVVVIDDLHWASQDSLELFGFLANRAEAAGVLVVGAYRDPDPGLERPTLAGLLATLARLPIATHLHLGGLDAHQVADYLAARLGPGVPGAVAHAVHAHTGGNPFYVREVATSLVSDGTLVQRDGRWLTDVSVPALGIPPTVRHVVRARMEALSADARAILQAASAFPEGFELQVVAAVAGLSEVLALDALDESLVCGFVRPAEPPAAPYAFAHAIVRHAIEDARSPDRSARLHRRAAEVLAEIRPGAPAAAVDQWWRSRSLAGAEAGVPVGLVAAESSSRAHAHRRAAHLLALTLDLVPPSDPHRRAEVLSRLAVAAARALDGQQAPEAVTEVLPLLDPVAGADLVVEVADALREGAPASSWEPLVKSALAAFPSGGGITWARLVTCLDPVSTVSAGSLRVGRWVGYPAEAAAVLAASDREDDQARAIEPFRARSPEQTDALVAQARAWTDPRARLRALDLAARDHSLRHGQPLAAVACYRELLTLGERIGSLGAQAEACAQLGLCLGLVGDFDEANVMIERARRLVCDLWPGHRLHLLGTVSSRVIVGYATGEAAWDELAAALRRWTDLPFAARAPWTVVFAALLAMIEALIGSRAAARDRVREVAGVLAQLRPEDHAVGGSLYFATAAAWELGDRDLAGHLLPLVDRQLEAGASPGPIGSVAQAKGRLAALTGGADARRWWTAARADAERAGLRPICLLVDYDESSALADAARIVALAPVLASAGMAGWAARAASGRASGGPGRRVAPAGLPAGLTVREAEVLGLLAGGRTSKEIAAELVLSVLTVNRHVANIYNKIGARNRAEATAFAHARDLTRTQF